MTEFDYKYYKRLKCKYPDRIPVYVEYSDINIDKKKFLVPEEMCVCSLVYYFRKLCKCDPTRGLIFFFNDTIYPPSVYIKEIENDNFIRVSIKEESIFG